MEIDECKIIKLYSDGMSLAEIERTTGLSRYFVKKIVSKSGVREFKHRMPLKQFNNSSVDKAIELYKSGVSLTKISKDIGIERHSLSRIIKERGIEIVNRQNSSRIDENSFSTIKTEEDAYWLGFLYADGCVSSVSYKIELALASKDSEHVSKFAKYLKYSKDNAVKIRHIKDDKYAARFSISNKTVWENLVSKGCIPNKSLILSYPSNNILNGLDKHFIRGYFDGDGCLSYRIGKNNIVHPSCSFVGTYDMLNNIKTVLGELGVRTSLFKTRNIYVLKLSGDKDNSDFLEYIYGDSTISLNRKYGRYKLLKDNNCTFDVFLKSYDN